VRRAARGQHQGRQQRGAEAGKGEQARGHHYASTRST
jgi:hypothetical protein